MAWLYVPDMGVSSSESERSWETRTGAFVTSSGRPSLRPLSWPGWTRRPWIARLSGTISRPSTAARGVARWISSLRASRASPSAPQASASGPKTIGGSGLTSSKSFATWDPGVVFLENVPGLTLHALNEVLGSLAGLGFDAEWACLSAEAVGAPHRRNRLWILAYDDGAGREILRRALNQPEDPSGHEPVRCRRDVADAECAAVPRQQRGTEAGALQAQPDDARGILADADSDGRARSFERGELFPPGRSPEAWSTIPADLQPPFPRLADGSPALVDHGDFAARLRLSGGGVVPLAAAHAFRALARRALT